MKRLIAVLTALLLMMSCMCALGAEEYSFPFTTEPVTLKVFTDNNSHMSDPEKNAMVAWYEEKTGVHIEWTRSAEVGTDLNLMVAGGADQYPDIILVQLNTAQVTTMAQAGMLMPLNDLIDEVGYNMETILEENPAFVSNLTAPDGNIYTLFYTDVGKHMPNRRKMFVYNEWMEKYMAETGNGVPATTDEFEEMLVFFRDADPNGNGKQDEIPLIASTNGEDNPIFYLMSAFTQISNNFFHITDDGEVVFEANSDEWREGLEWMHHLYEEGLFYAEESYVQDRDTLRSIVNVADKSNYVVGATTSFWEGRFVDTSVLNWTDFMPLAPIAGPEGVIGATITAPETFVLCSAITTACEYPEVAMMWLDWWLSEEGGVAGMYGLEDVSYRIVDKPDFLGNSTSISSISDSYTSNYRFGEVVPRHDRQEVRYGATNDESTILTSNTFVLFRAGQMYEPYYVKSNVPQIMWAGDADLENKISELRGVINSEVNTAYTEFILGLRDIDTDWDAYVETLNTLGLDQYIELMEEYYIG